MDRGEETGSRDGPFEKATSRDSTWLWKGSYVLDHRVSFDVMFGLAMKFTLGLENSRRDGIGVGYTPEVRKEGRTSPTTSRPELHPPGNPFGAGVEGPTPPRMHPHRGGSVRNGGFTFWPAD